MTTAGEHARQNAFWTGLAALAFLYFGWLGGGWVVPSSAGSFYRLTVHVFDWMLKLGGIGLAIVAVLCVAGKRIGLLADVLVSGACGLLLIICPFVWALNDGIGVQYLLYMLIGGMFLNAARRNWSDYRSSAGIPVAAPIARAPVPPVQPRPEPVHPASVHPSSLPEDGPPPEGYLAALANEQDEPPKASYE